MEKLERGEPVDTFSDGTEDNYPGLRAGYYPGWESDIDLSVYEGLNLTDLPQTTETPEWRKNAVGKSYGMVWIDAEINPSSGCGWGKDYARNCDLLEEFITLLQHKGLTVGVYSSEYMWETIMGGRGECTRVAK